MLPAAVVVHEMPGRMRLRIAERRCDEAWFARVTRQLRDCPTVLDATPTPITGSILIQYDGTDANVIRSYAQTLELFEVVTSLERRDAGGPPPDEVIRTGLSIVDGWMRRQTGNGTDLRSVALVGLLGAAVWQTLRGHVLPAGATLLWYAIALSTERRPDGPDREPEPALQATNATKQRVASRADWQGA
jgi:hypothetical protein